MEESRLITIHLPSQRWKSLMSPMIVATTTQITTLETASKRVSPGKLAAKLNGTILVTQILSFALPPNSSGEEGFSQTHIVLRNMETSYQQFVYDDVKTLTTQTGCVKPCMYRKYRLFGDPQVKESRS